MNQKEVGKKIKSIRESQGLTREEFAKKLNVSIHTIANYEQGQRGSNTRVLNKIADALGVSTVELLGADKIGSSKTFVNDDLKITHVYPTKNIEKPKLDQYNDITLISEYIGRKADLRDHIISNWGEIIKDVDDYIDSKIAKSILDRGINK